MSLMAETPVLHDGHALHLGQIVSAHETKQRVEGTAEETQLLFCGPPVELIG